MIRNEKGGGYPHTLEAGSPKNEKTNLYKYYHKHSVESSEKSLRGKLAGEIAGLLFYLQNPLSRDRRQKTWRIFELKLRQYLDLKVREVPL